LRYLFEGYSLDPDRRELRRGVSLIDVEPQVFDLLEHLIRNRDHVVSRDDLIASIWRGRVISESVLSTRINAARSAIGDSGVEQRLIKTLPRKGVRFIGDVREERKPREPTATNAATSYPEPVPSLQTSSIAERRRLTVLSSELLLRAPAGAGEMDTEDLWETIDAYHRCVVELVGSFSGIVDYAAGRTMLAHFGYPVAHEDDAAQALRAGLELCAAVACLKTQGNIRLRGRVGIATGEVMVGNLKGGDTREYALVGEVPSIASRLLNAAHPNSVFIDGDTRYLIGSLFDCRDVDPIIVSETNETLCAWQVLGANTIEGRFEVLRSIALTPLVGREEEIELLGRRWSRAKSGEGQVVLLAGEAGIGKSRLTVTVSERLAAERHSRLRYFCSPQNSDSAFHPIIGQIERVAGLARDDTPKAKLDKIDMMLAQSPTSIEDAALIAAMLSVPNDGRYPALDLTPAQRRQRTMEALIAQTEALTRRNPLLMIFEDAHWADPTSLEVLDRLAHAVRTLRVLLIVTFRPNFEPPWIGRPYVTALTINRLGRRDIKLMIDSVVGNKPVPTNIRRDIIERTDGIPLFVEEMTKAVLEARNVGAAAASVSSSVSAVPASLYASLIARLDRLGPAKESAQIGAAIGREFSHELLTAVAGRHEAELGLELERLIAAGLLFRRGVPPHATYFFKHTLLRDAAYGTLLREPRLALHARIAEILESKFADVAERQPELLARHCTEAGLIEKAAGLWGKAGHRSLDRSALVEATVQLTRALDQIATLPSTPVLRREQIKVQVALITPLMHVKGYAAPESRVAVERARLLIERVEALGEHLEDPLLLFSVLYGLWAASYVAFDGDLCCGLARQFLEIAEKQGATIPLMVANRMMGTSLLFTGETAQAQEHLDRAIALYDRTEHRPLARFGQDVWVSILSFRSLALWLLGYPDAALADSEQALNHAREIGQAVALMYALTMTSWIHIHCRNYATADTRAAELCSLAGEKDAALWNAFGMLSQGGVLELTGKALAAVQILASGLTALRATGATFWAPLSLSYLASAHADLGQFAEARRCIGEAIVVVETTDERWWEPEVCRVAGEIALKSPEPDAAKAESYFQQAITVARKQQAKSLELRAVMSMARLWRDQGNRDEARDLLASVYNWFTEGFDTVDLKEAESLLKALAS
jgi:DNA-binding winged helix-turn-helix (wHTH) protein/predicted ATPase